MPIPVPEVYIFRGRSLCREGKTNDIRAYDTKDFNVTGILFYFF